MTPPECQTCHFYKLIPFTVGKCWRKHPIDSPYCPSITDTRVDGKCGTEGKWFERKRPRKIPSHRMEWSVA